MISRIAFLILLIFTTLLKFRYPNIDFLNFLYIFILGIGLYFGYKIIMKISSKIFRDRE